jgi:hypothetical protein
MTMNDLSHVREGEEKVECGYEEHQLLLLCSSSFDVWRSLAPARGATTLHPSKQDGQSTIVVDQPIFVRRAAILLACHQAQSSHLPGSDAILWSG